MSALAAVAPGTALREGIDRILQASMGALIVVGDGPEVLNICSGGFLLDAAFSPQRLSELAKMDGAIILASDSSRIARANVHLVPNPNVPTSETGTRHRTAERVARSIDAPVVSVSEAMSTITVYMGEFKHVLQPPTDIVFRANQALRTLERFHAVVIGPGLGRRDEMAASTRQMMLNAPLPMVIDGDGLFALAWNADGVSALLKRRTAPTVLTPHDGEMKLLTGAPPGRDRIAAARALARDCGCIVLLKGPATVVAEPGGDALVVTAGDERLATAGTGDVLAGIVGTLLAQRVHPFHAAAAGAWVHGRAARFGPAVGFVASDLPDLIPQVLSQL